MIIKKDKFFDYDKYWILVMSFIGVEAGIVGVTAPEPILVASSIFLLLFTSILVRLEYSMKRVVLHAFIWVEVVAWFSYMFRK